MTCEASLLRRILRLSRGNIRLFRNNRGKAYMGVVVHKTPEYVTLKSYRFIEFGLVNGAADIIGWRSIKIGPEHVGMTIAQFVSIEAKGSRTVTTEAQKSWCDVAGSMGAAASIVREEQAARELLGIS